MNKKLILIKYEFLNFLKSEKDRRFFLLLYGVGSIVLFGMFFVSGYYSIKESNTSSTIFMVILVGLFSTSIFIFSYNLLVVGEYLFKSTDYETLASLPITNEDIVVSKLSVVFIYNLVINIVVNFAGLFAVWAFEKNIGFLINIIVFTIVFTILLLSLSILLSYFISLISSLYKNSNIALTLLSFGIIIFFIMTGNFMGNESGMNEDEFIKLFQNSFFGNVINNLLINGNPLAILVFTITVLLLFVFVIRWISRDYIKIINSLNSSYKREEYLLTNQKSRNELFSLVTNDIKRLIRIPMYFLNSILGMVFLLITTIGFYLKKDLLLEVTKLQFSFELSKYYPVGFILILTAFLMMTFINSSTISLEGENINTLKTLPILTKDILKSKVMSSFIIIFPLCFISLLVYIFTFSLSFFDVIINLITTVLIAILNSQVFLLINLYYPKFKWTNLNQVIKNSSSIIVSLIVGAIIFFITMSLAVLSNFSSFALMLYFNIFTLIIDKILMTKGIKKFDSYIL